IREETVRRLAVVRSAVLQRDEQRSRFLVISPGRNDDMLGGSSRAIGHFFDSTVGADVEVPGITRRITAIGRILYRDLLRGTFPQWQILHAGIFHRSVGVPDDMKGEDEPIIIIQEV